MPPTPSTGLSPQFYELGPDGFARIDIKRTPLSNVDAQLKELANDSAVVIPRMATVLEAPVHMVLAPKRITMVRAVNKLRLATYYRITPSARRGTPGRVTPVFNANNGAIQLALLWSPPANMRMWFMTHFVTSTAGGQSYWAWEYCSLVCTSTDEGFKNHCFKPQLPNIYDNAKVCMGEQPGEIQNGANTPMFDAFVKSCMMFDANSWNTDLNNLNNPAYTEEMFSFSDADNKTQMPMPSDWPSKWARVSNAAFANVPFTSF